MASEFAYLPPTLRKGWSPNETEKQVSPEVAKWYLAQFQNDREIAGAMRAAGVQMMAASDSLDRAALDRMLAEARAAAR